MADIPMFHFDVRPVPQPYQSPLTLSMAQLVGAGDKYQAQAIQQSAAATARGVENIGQNIGDTLATYAKYQLRQQDPQYQLERMRLQKAREDAADDALIRQTMAANGGDLDKTLTVLEKSGGIGITAASKVRAMVAADKKDKLDTSVKQLTLREKATDILTRGLPDSPADPTNPDQVMKFREDYRQVLPDISAIVGPEFTKGLPSPDDPDVIAGVERAKKFGMSNQELAAKQRLAIERLTEDRLTAKSKSEEAAANNKFAGRMFYTAHDQASWDDAIKTVTPLIPGDADAKAAVLAQFGPTYTPEARARAGVFGEVATPRTAAGVMTDPVEKSRMLDTIAKNPNLWNGLREVTRESLMSDLQDRGFTFPAVTPAQILAAKARRDTALRAIEQNPRLLTDEKEARKKEVFDAYDDQVGVGAGGIVPPKAPPDAAAAAAAAPAVAAPVVAAPVVAAPAVPAPMGFADQPPGVPNADQNLTPTVTPIARPPVAGVPDERQFTSNVRVNGQPVAPAAAPAPYGLREDGTPKGKGFLGVLPRTDGGVSSEISIGVGIDGKEVQIPTMVPTLDKSEVSWLLSHDISDPQKIPASIKDKAIAFARERIAAGKSPFAGADESPQTPAAKPTKLPVMNPEKVHVILDGQRYEFDSEEKRDEFMKQLGLSSKPNPSEPGAPPAPATPGAAAPGGKMTVDPAFLSELQRREGGFVETPYDDSGTGKAIGYGMHTFNGKPVTPGMQITKEQADAEMQRQIDKVYAPIVDRALKVPVTQTQYNELISMAWNSPQAALSVIAKLNKHQPLSPEDFQRSATIRGEPNKGLSQRRQLEAAPFLNP